MTAIGDTRRMAETGTGSGRSPSGAGAPSGAIALTPLYCELGDHHVSSAIYRPKLNDKFGCAEHIIHHLGHTPAFLRSEG